MGTIPTHQNAERSRKRKTIFLGLNLFLRDLWYLKNDLTFHLTSTRLNCLFSFRKWENNNLSNIAQIKVLASTNKKNSTWVNSMTYRGQHRMCIICEFFGRKKCLKNSPPLDDDDM